MAMPATQQTKSDNRKTGLSLLFGIVVWVLHQNTAYALASWSCERGLFSFQIAGLSGLQLVETLLTVAAMLLMLYLIYVPGCNWRRFQTAKPSNNPRMLLDTEKDRRPLIAFVTMLLNSLFLLFVIATFVPVFALNACG